MICPQCGYHRQEKDNIVSFAECPKCGIIYSKLKNEAPLENTVETHDESSDQAPLPQQKHKIKPEKMVIYAVAVVVLIIVLHSLVIPQAGRLFKSTHVIDASNSSVHEQAPHTNSSRATDDSNEKPFSEGNFFTAGVVSIKTRSGITGSGFFINRSGDIVTSGRILRTGDTALVKISNGSSFNVNEIVARDARNDLVIASTSVPSQYVTPVEINTHLPRTGESVFIPGQQKGARRAVATGHVSDLRQSGQGITFIEVTAEASPDADGAPLFNAQGEVIGVTLLRAAVGEGINRCIAAEEINSLDRGRRFSFTVPDSRMPSSERQDVYCYVGSDGHVNFVEWQTQMLLSRPDGSLDGEKFEKWVLDEIGGNPDNINPEKEAHDDLERNREMLFKSVFPHRSMSDTNLTSGEKDWLEARYRRHYVEVYNRWNAKREDTIRKYNMMMADFQRFNAQRKN